MEDRNYKVNIKDIYIGDVIGIYKPEDMCLIRKIKSRSFLNKARQLEWMKENDNRNYLIKAMKLDDDSTDEAIIINYHRGDNYYTGNFLFRRSMLFTLDENRHANDLLYNSPHYPIFNISPHEDCLKAPICVGHYTYEMYKLLHYFGYSDEIGYEDVLNIRNTFFSCDYALDNCETFGVRETDPNESSLEIHDSKGNHRTFNEFIEDAPFSWRYFHMLIANHDEWSFSDHCVRDSFKPCDGEGPIKSLGTLKKR